MGNIDTFLIDYAAFNERLRQMDKDCIDRCGLTFIQAAALRAIAQGARRPKEVAVALRIEKSQTLVGLLDRLERDGYVNRDRSLIPGDRRSTGLVLSTKGSVTAQLVAEALESATVAA